MRKMAYLSKYTSQSHRAFTLIEILITLSLIGIVFSVLSFGFYSSINSSIQISMESKKIEDMAKFYWDFQRRFATSKQIFVKKTGDNSYIISLYNTAGEFSKGVVKSVYYTKDGFLYYYEYPYIFADPLYFDEKDSFVLMKIDKISLEIYSQGQKFDEFQGKADYMVLMINDKKMVFR